MKTQENTWHLPINKFTAQDENGDLKEFSKNDGAFFVTKAGLLLEFTHLDKKYTANGSTKIKRALHLADIEPYLIFKAIRGSHAYGTNIETSDIDQIGIYVLPDKYIKAVTFDSDWEDIHVKDQKNNMECTYYDLRKFLRLVQENNPNTFEVFNLSSDCILYKDPVFDIVLNHEKKFITKKCYDSFLRYASQQIKKSQTQDRKQNWEKSRMERKTVLDFCYTFDGQGSRPIKDWLNDKCFSQEDCGLTAIEHMRYTYGLYNSTEGLYRGIVSDENISNDVSLSETPIGAIPVCYIQFNSDGYQQHCSEWKSYQTWLKERNENRWVEHKQSGGKLDGKNLLHCVRLIMMAEDIAEGRGIVVRRPEAEYLKSIRKGEVKLEDLITWSSTKLAELEEKFVNSELPDDVDPEFIQYIYDSIRGRLKNHDRIVSRY